MRLMNGGHYRQVQISEWLPVIAYDVRRHYFSVLQPIEPIQVACCDRP